MFFKMKIHFQIKLTRVSKLSNCYASERLDFNMHYFQLGDFIFD